MSFYIMFSLNLASQSVNINYSLKILLSPPPHPPPTSLNRFGGGFGLRDGFFNACLGSEKCEIRSHELHILCKTENSVQDLEG